MRDCRGRSRPRDRMDENVSPISEPSFQRLFTELAKGNVTKSLEEPLAPEVLAVLGENVLAAVGSDAVDPVAVDTGDMGERDTAVLETLLKGRKLLGACELLVPWGDGRIPDKLLLSLSAILALLLRLLGSENAVAVPRVIS